MPGRPHDTRLLENLVKCEKDYYAALINLLALSHSSTTSLAGYASTLTPATSQAVTKVVQESLNAVDDGLRVYADSIDDWREKLGEIKRLDGDIENAYRDREILVTRLLKVSKQKPKGVGSSSTVGKGSSVTKLSQAQAELQACEAHLTAKQRELDEITRSAVKDGLERRCNAIVTCGLVWTEKGRDGLKMLETLGHVSDLNGGPLPSPHPPYSNLSRPYFSRLANGSAGVTISSNHSNTSIAPSQSASQVGVNDDHPRPSEDTQVTNSNTLRSPISLPLPLPISNTIDKQAQVNATIISLNSRPNSYHLNIPPAHSIDEHVVPDSTIIPITLAEPAAAAAPAMEDEGSGSGSSVDEREEEESRQIEVHDNPARTTTTIAAMLPSPAPPPVPPVPEQSKVQQPPKAKSPITTTFDPPPQQRVNSTVSTPKSSPVRSRVSNFLHRSSSDHNTNKPPHPPPPPLPSASPSAMPLTKQSQQQRRRRNDSSPPSPVSQRKNTGLFGGLRAFFNPPKGAGGGSARSSSPVAPRGRDRPALMDRDTSPTATVRRRPTSGAANGWKTRTDRNLTEGKNEMIVGSLRGPIASQDSSSSDEERSGKKQKKGGGGSLFVMRNNNNSSTRQAQLGDRDVMGNPVTGPPLTSTSTPTPAQSKIGSIARSTKKRTGSDDHELVGTAGGRVSGIRTEGESSDSIMVKRKPSRRSSVGATPTSTPRARDVITSNTYASDTAAAAPKIPPRNPLREATPPPRRSTITTGGGKIRKRAPAKQFDDGLGSSGGALIVGPQESKAVGTAAGNESFGGMGLGDGGASVSRMTSTVRSTAAGAAAGGIIIANRGGGGGSGGHHHARKASGSSTEDSALPRSPTVTTTSNASTSRTTAPQQTSNKSSSVSRNTSISSRAGSNMSRVGRGGNNLMSIVEAPSTGSGNPPVLLEMVRAPGSITGPQAPILEPPSKTMVEVRRNGDGFLPSQNSGGGGSKLLLPSEMPNGRGSLPNDINSTYPSNVQASASTSRLAESVRTREKRVSVPSASALAPPPLRSALRTRSPSPSPPAASLSAPNLLNTIKAPSSVLPAIHPSSKAFFKDDADSISSYETGHEIFEDALSTPTRTPPPSIGNGLLGFNPPEKRGSDGNRSTDLSVSNETDSTTQPKRRKSVRMALPPSATSTPAATPAALEDPYSLDHNQVQHKSPQHYRDNASERTITERRSAPATDAWADDDSDAGGDYGEARKVLQRATEELAKAGRKKRATTDG